MANTVSGSKAHLAKRADNFGAAVNDGLDEGGKVAENQCQNAGSAWIAES